MQYEKILKRIKPSENEKKKVHEFTERLVETAKKISHLDVVICGSLGKGTWLSGNHDIDIFIVFPREAKREDLEKKGLEFGARIAKELNGKYSVKYAEHPYTNASIEEFIVDIVPCYHIEKGEKIISAVDRSPLHLEFIKNNLKEEQKDEVLLLKQFCKSAGLYGSDAKTQGFSGYICELLIIKYGSFDALMKAAGGWHLPYTVDLGEKSYHKEIFVVVDPTDINRNAASVVSPINIVKFIHRSKQFMKKPSDAFFQIEKELPLKANEIKSLKRRETHFIAVSMKKPDIIDDILYQQARKAVSRLYGIFKHNEFVPMRAFEFLGNDNIGSSMILVFELETGSLPEAKKMVGPPLFARKHVDEFIDKYRKSEFGVYIEGSNVVADKKRDYKTPFSLMKDIMNKPEKELSELGIPGNMIKPLKSGKIHENAAFFSLLHDKEFSAHMNRMYFEKVID